MLQTFVQVVGFTIAGSVSDGPTTSGITASQIAAAATAPVVLVTLIVIVIVAMVFIYMLKKRKAKSLHSGIAFQRELHVRASIKEQDLAEERIYVGRYTYELLYTKLYI